MAEKPSGAEADGTPSEEDGGETNGDGATAESSGTAESESGGLKPGDVGSEVKTSEKIVLTQDQWEQSQRLLVDAKITDSQVRVPEAVVYTLAGHSRAALASFETWDFTAGRGDASPNGIDVVAIFGWKEGGERREARFGLNFGVDQVFTADEAARSMVDAVEKLSLPEEADVLPKAYVPGGQKPADRWTGKAKKVLDGKRHRAEILALDAVLKQARLMEVLRHYAVARLGAVEKLEHCFDRRRCRWRVRRRRNDRLAVSFNMDAGTGGPEPVDFVVDADAWEVVGAGPAARAMLALIGESAEPLETDDAEEALPEETSEATDEDAAGGENRPGLPEHPPRDAVQDKMEANLEAMQGCLEGADGLSAGQNVYLRFRIETSGAVAFRAVKPTSLTGSDAARCLQKRLEALTFPKSREGQVVNYPVVAPE